MDEVLTKNPRDKSSTTKKSNRRRARDRLDRERDGARFEEQNALQIEIREQRKTCKTAIAKSDLVAHTVSVSLRGNCRFEEEVKRLRREESVRDRAHAHVADRVFRAMLRHHRIKHRECVAIDAEDTRSGDRRLRGKHTTREGATEAFQQLHIYKDAERRLRGGREEVVRRREDDERTSHALDSKVSDLEKHTREKDASSPRLALDGCEEAREGQTPRQNDGVAHAIMSASGRRGGRYRAWKT